VFLLLIFFLVASIPDETTAVQLPPARHGKVVNPRTAVILTVAEGGGPRGASVYLGDGKVGTVLRRDKEITNAVRERFDEGKSSVLIKAERGVKHREVSRVAAAATAAAAEKSRGIRLHLAVLEIE
jgi:biopolymer transport protein ExbD